MQKITYLLFAAILPLFCHAQATDSVLTFRDTINLAEVNVSANLPLGNNDIIGFYRTNHFSPLDNINARLEGMSLIKRGAYAMEPQLHGFSGGQLNVTIDGMKMFGACTDKMDPVTSYMEPTNLKKITINQGTTGCQTGCNIGGSVDMALMEPTGKNAAPFGSSLGLGYESVSKSRNILFTSGYSKNKWAVGVNSVYRKNENYRDGKNQQVLFSQFQKVNMHAVAKYTPDSTQSFKTDFLYDDARHVGYPALPMDVGVAKAILIALEYRRMSRVQWKAKWYVNTIHHIMDDSKRDSMYFLYNKATDKTDTVYMRMDMPGKSSTLGAYLQMEAPWGSRNKLTLKVDHYTNHSLAEMTMHMRYAGLSPELPMYMQTWPEMLRNASGLFVQNTTFVSPNLVLMVNGRIDYNTDLLMSDYGQQQFSVFNYTLPKKQGKFVKSLNLSAQYRLMKGISAVATAGYAERMPTIGERLGFYLYNAYDGYDYIGNPYIHSEKSTFLRTAFQLSGRRIQLSASQSLSIVKDYIMGITDTLVPAMNFYAKGIRVYGNIPSAMLYSIDLQVLYNPANNLSIFMVSKYTLGKIKTGEPLPLISPIKNVLALQYEKKRFTFRAENETSLAQTRVNKHYGEQKTPAFTVFNLKGSYHFAMPKTGLDVSLGITNVLNRAYYEHLDWGKIYRPGRSFDVYIGYAF